MHEHRFPTIEKIKTLEIPKVMISQAAEISPKRISDFLKYRTIPTAMEAKIIRTIEDIARVWEAFKPFRVDLDSPELLEAGVQIAQEIEMTRELQKAQLEISQTLPAL